MIDTDDIALVHDYLLVLRGAERTFAAIGDCWPTAPVSTLLYDPEGTEGRFERHRVRTSRLQRTGATQASFRRLLPFFPLAAERLPVQDRRVVVSSSSAFAQGVHPDPGAVHVSYCHTPFRYAWFEQERALAESPAPVRPALKALLAAIRRWDLNASERVTSYVANSKGTQRRIRELYKRDATVIHPPVEVERFQRDEPEDYFLTVTEVVPHKRVEVAAAAAERASQPLKVVGSGPDLDRLRSEYGDHVEFLGRVDDDGLEELYAKAAAVIVPNVEEFGIAAVEGQASGRPVIAARAGGVLETVVEGETGHFFEPDDADELAGAMSSFDPHRYDPDAIQQNAQRFSKQAFQERLHDEVERVAAGSAG
jgi:glycosyltransferase involved in cell wall biosynthesis